MAVEVKPKVSAYANRNSNSIAAPIEIDSDSDFVSGPVPTVVKEKRKTKRKSAKRQPEESEDSNVYDIDKSRKKKQKTKRGPRARRRATSDDNPLLEFFNNLDLHSDSSEDERRPMDDDPMEGPSYDAEDDGSGSEADDDSPAPVNTFAKFVNRLPPPPVPPPPVPSTGDTTEDDTDEAEVDPDATESDSDVPPEPAPTKPVLKTANKPVSKRAATPKSDSATESDSDVDDPVEATPAEVAPLSSPPTSSGRSRPGFPLSLDQCELGPMVLDAEQGIEVPGAINTYLREYQREGVRFFWERYKEGRGALLGDDMGLVRVVPVVPEDTDRHFAIFVLRARRKTIQVIAFLSAIMKKTGFKTDRDRRHMHVSALQDGREWKRHKKLPPANATWPTCLIIAPSSVVGNWEREFRTWGYFEVGSYMGKPDERKTVLDEFKMGRLDVMLTSLDLARRDIEDLEDLSWSCVIVDEVHTVKNPASKTSKAYNSFECLRRIGLTGTAIQNSYDELWTILDWTNPGRVGDIRQWRGFVSNPLKLGQSATASDAQRLQAHKVSQILRDQVLPRFFLRRTKSIIAHQLPSKTDEVVFCPLTSVQIDVYKKILDMDEIKYALNRDELCECGSGSVVKKCCHPFDPATIFKFMSVLIKLSNHLGLILPSPSDTKEQTVRNRHWASLAFPDGDAPQWEIAQTKKKYCGKWGVLNGLMKSWKIDPTTKILIFTKTVKLLDMLAHHLKIEGYGFVRLDGNTKQLDRMPMIDKFHTDPGISVFLISTMAGGTGLNLTGANKVIIFDPNWNPAHDLQAMDRAFRFGQTRDVSVYRLLGAGSVEELIYARQVYKQQQMKIGYEASIQTRYFAGVQGDKSRQGELFGLANIFKLHEGGLSTKIAIEKAQLAELDWALASMDAPRSSSGKKKTGVDITEVETNLDKEYGDLKGLGSLLFDDGLPQASQEAAGAIKGMYTHQNADLLVSSKIEQERTKVAQKKQRKSRKSAPVDTSPPPSWPPRRGVRHRHRHRSPSPTHEQRLNKRMAALIGTGMISHPDEYTSFAKAFGYSKEEREYTLKQLDDYREDSSDEGQHDKAVPMELEPEDIDM